MRHGDGDMKVQVFAKYQDLKIKLMYYLSAILNNEILKC